MLVIFIMFYLHLMVETTPLQNHMQLYLLLILMIIGTYIQLIVMGVVCGELPMILRLTQILYGRLMGKVLPFNPIVPAIRIFL